MQTGTRNEQLFNAVIVHSNLKIKFDLPEVSQEETDWKTYIEFFIYESDLPCAIG